MTAFESLPDDASIEEVVRALVEDGELRVAGINADGEAMFERVPA
jgi:hypothetical protein